MRINEELRIRFYKCGRTFVGIFLDISAMALMLFTALLTTACAPVFLLMGLNAVRRWNTIFNKTWWSVIAAPLSIASGIFTFVRLIFEIAVLSIVDFLANLSAYCDAGYQFLVGNFCR